MNGRTELFVIIYIIHYINYKYSMDCNDIFVSYQYTIYNTVLITQIDNQCTVRTQLFVSSVAQGIPLPSVDTKASKELRKML